MAVVTQSEKFTSIQGSGPNSRHLIIENYSGNKDSYQDSAACASIPRLRLLFELIYDGPERLKSVGSGWNMNRMMKRQLARAIAILFLLYTGVNMAAP
jgi:hypothetical protein